MSDKLCCRCKATKSIDEFYKNATRRDGISSFCKVCAAQYGATYRSQNPEKVREGRRDWKARNPDKVKEMDKRHRNLHLEDRHARHSAWRIRNIDSVRERHKEWQKNNSERIREYENNRRARELSAGGDVSLAEWLDLCEKYGNKCLCCKRDDVKLSMDHVVPISRGGSNTIDNIQPLCKPCNSKKYTKTIDYRTPVLDND